MPSMDMLLTWVVRVDTAMLGAHLEAYINLQPTVQALRLCNRFGNGDDVHINRLPVEIVTKIESYLIEAAREDTELEWSPNHFCFAGMCEPIDHYYSEEELVRLHAHYCGSEGVGKAAGELDDEQRAELNQQMAEEYCMKEEIISALMTGASITTGRSLLRTHFGLNSWLSHKPSPVENDYHVGMASLDTVAYLTLPTTAATTKYEPRRLAGLECTVRLPTENVYELAVSPPEQPSEKSLARFARALKMLDLEAWPLNWRQDLVDGKVQEDKKNVDSDGSSVSSKAEGPPKGWKENTGPALRLLVSNRDDSAPEEVSG
ncbi:hypothetical protein LTR56_010535 [Elasticomyces elasticus]|nr:hypothetical protein LTR56_010535 [Elasticomyces elasticus]KAK3657951.1 hypothetical protein LTR22_009178 [Elasticomyces elasticus]KAK5762858.1 hypothetical protein LTS12_007047 [Elasticomyces elasticus]